MAKQNINPIIVILVIIGAIYLLNNSSLFSISLESKMVQYTNVPVEARFKTNFSAPVIKAYYNDVQLFEKHTEEINGTNVTLPQNQNIIFSQATINGSYVLIIKNVSQAGIFKFTATEGNVTDIQVIEVRTPFVDMTSNINTTVDEGTQSKITIKTFNPQGNDLVADGIDMYVINPDNTQTTITPTKGTTNLYDFNFNYKDAGNYQFKIKPRKEGYDTKEFTVITTVTKSAGIPFILYIWFSAAVIFIILFLIARFRK